MNNYKNIKVKYKNDLKRHKLVIKNINQKIKNAKSEKARKNYLQKLNEMNLRFYKDRKEKYGFYEKINQLTKKYRGTRNVSKEDFKEWKKWQRSLLGKAERSYLRFLAVNKNLDLSKVSVNIRNKNGSEKFSLTYLLNQTINVFPVNTQEFEDLKKISNKAFDRLSKVKPRNNNGFWENSDFHLGTIYTNASNNKEDYEIKEMEKGEEFDDSLNDYKEIEYEEDGEKYSELELEEKNKEEDDFYKGQYDDNLEPSWTEYEESEEERPNPKDISNTKNLGPFKIVYNISNSDLIEDIKVIDKNVSMDDFNRLEKYISKHKFPNKVNMNRLKGSIKRRETWRKKRQVKEWRRKGIW